MTITHTEMTTLTVIPKSSYEELKNENERLRMTLRDQFAMAALTGILSAPDQYTLTEYEVSAVREAYKCADAMMEARDENK